MLVYLYDYATGAYLGERHLTMADIDPRTHAWLVPGNATVEAPPRCDAHCIPVRRDGRWVVYELVADIPDGLLENCRAVVIDITKRKAP